MTEAIGFWICAIGWLATILIVSLSNSKLEAKIPFPIQVAGFLGGMLLMGIGGFMVCIGGGGQYPPYPLR